MKRLQQILLLTGLTFLLAACSQGTQNLRLAPQPAETGEVTGGGLPVSLQVVDMRTDRDLGMLENPDGSIVRLLPADDVNYAIQLAAAETLRDYGFEPALWDGQAEPRLEIRIQVLIHDVTAGVPYKLDTEIALQGVAWMNGERFTGRAQTTLTRQRALPPGEKANAEAIDTAITRALGQLLNEEMANFLAGRG
ncbi:YajG family lipoprotein [Spiribacter sp. 221]|uniref:YajG family lipoprotein n=1 Tax=Spiribacter onubensis TaxID=3122420 RepID=UPI00349F7D96